MTVRNVGLGGDHVRPTLSEEQKASIKAKIVAADKDPNPNPNFEGRLEKDPNVNVNIDVTETGVVFLNQQA